jgi:rhamnogalacturonyl hydrolase YesR
MIKLDDDYEKFHGLDMEKQEEIAQEVAEAQKDARIDAETEYYQGDISGFLDMLESTNEDEKIELTCEIFDTILKYNGDEKIVHQMKQRIIKSMRDMARVNQDAN